MLMIKTTVYLPDDLKEALTPHGGGHWTFRGGPDPETLAELISTAERPRPRGGLSASGDQSLASHVDDALAGFGER